MHGSPCTLVASLQPMHLKMPLRGQSHHAEEFEGDRLGRATAMKCCFPQISPTTWLPSGPEKLVRPPPP